MPNGNNVYDLAYQAGIAVQAGDRGQLHTSLDGSLFVAHNTGTSRALRALAFFKDGLIVTGEEGTTLFAPTAALTNIALPATFNRVQLTTTDWLEGVAASATLAVAVGDNGAVYTTPNGTNWTRNSTTLGAWLRGVACGNGTFVTVGEAGYIAYSPNGTSWQRASSPVTTDLNRVAWVNDRFVAVGTTGTILVSPAGRAWTALTGSGATGDLFAIAGGTNSLTGLAQLLVAGDSEVRTFELGLWSNETASTKAEPAPLWPFYGAYFDGLYYVLGGSAGLQVEGVKTNLNSAYAWFDRSTSLRTWLWDLTRIDNLYVAVGDLGTIQTSPNGINWDLELVSGAATNSVLLGIGGRSRLLVAVGSQGTILTSTNAVSWSAVEPRPVTDDLQGVAAFANNIYVTGGNGALLSSTNGLSWTLHTRLSTDFLSGIATFPGGLAIAGENGALFTSPNGQLWTAQARTTTNWLSRIRYLADRLIAVGENGTILTSTNGSSWTSRTGITSAWLNDVALFNGWFYAFGTQGTVLASSNALDWISVPIPTQKALFAAASDRHQLVTAGVDGAILRGLPSPLDILDFNRNQSTNAFLLSGPPGRQFTIQATTNTSPWTPTLTAQFLDNSGAAVATESRTTPPRNEIYRARLVP
jgi:hypothetical protein